MIESVKRIGDFFAGGVANLQRRDQARRHVQQQGFTLVEMLVVLALIGMVTALIGPPVVGYLGGATNHHVRMQETEFVVPVLLGVVAWLGLYLRDTRIRQLVPIRK